jgi:threonine aldolase
VWSPSQTKPVFDFPKSHELRVHMDGARIFNAAAAQDRCAPVPVVRGHTDDLSLSGLERTDRLIGGREPRVYRPR